MPWIRWPRTHDLQAIMDERLRPTERLKHASEYVALFAKGRCFSSTHLRVHYRPNDRGFSRLGLVVSRRVGKAVSRNRVKRILREIFRKNKSFLRVPMDIVLVPRGKPRTHREYSEVFGSFMEKLERGG